MYVDVLDFDLCFREYAFADVGNLEHCTKYLNQTLVTYGFPASLDLFASDPVRVDVDLRFGFAWICTSCCYYFYLTVLAVLCRFRLRGLAIAYTRCFSRGSVMLNLETLLMSRDSGNRFELCFCTI